MAYFTLSINVTLSYQQGNRIWELSCQDPYSADPIIQIGIGIAIEIE
ncbi:MAG: hypothetical protein P8010_25435 [Desulfosarcinaceae bacterium]|jgi:hypothetical protein